MPEFDVVIVGAGPAGGQCARLLALANYRVLLVEQQENFDRHNFSSAATPLETLKQFDLPTEVVGSFWHNITIVTSKIDRTWNSSKPLGAVLNFAKLRQFLAREVTNFGGEVWLGCRYIKYVTTENKTQVVLRTKGSKTDIIVSTKVLVDATGFTRAVIYPNKRDKPNFLKGSGLEYLIKVDREIFDRFAKSLTFFMGYKWMPQGYSWIFPMENRLLKVGAAYVHGEHAHIRQIKPPKYYIELLLTEYMNIPHYQIIDVHGSILEYSSGLNDIYYQNNIIAIGDAVSTVNFLGGEGIRHAMYGAKIAVKYIEAYLQNKLTNFAPYQKELKQHFGFKWNLSEKISRKVYLAYKDTKIDTRVSALTALSTKELTEMLFEYNLTLAYKVFRSYLNQKIRSFFFN
ncbi:MAG: NAD(P)/FAD-dependent oxidoreductase [Xenococcaceae cyanobacterium]